MQKFYPTRFEGSIEELRQYHMVIVNTAAIYKTLQRNAELIRDNLFINDYETEELVGWCIKELIKRAFPEIKVIDHRFNDIFEMICDQLFTGYEHILRAQITPSLVNCKIIRCFRVLPMMDKTMLAIGT